MTAKRATTAPHQVTAAEVRTQCGDLLDWQVEAIVGTGATPGQLEEARAWAAGQDDQMGEARRPLSGTVAQLYDILTAEEALDEDDAVEPAAAPDDRLPS